MDGHWIVDRLWELASSDQLVPGVKTQIDQAVCEELEDGLELVKVNFHVGLPTSRKTSADGSVLYSSDQQRLTYTFVADPELAWKDSLLDFRKFVNGWISLSVR